MKQINTYTGFTIHAIPQSQVKFCPYKIPEIDLVVVNLYPFAQTVAKGESFDNVIEQIDIGGPCMIRAAAKNHRYVSVLTSPDQYTKFLKEMEPLRIDVIR